MSVPASPLTIADVDARIAAALAAAAPALTETRVRAIADEQIAAHPDIDVFDRDAVAQVVAEQLAAHPGSPALTDANGKPTIAALSNQLCPRCATGRLTITNYDPAASYEKGQVIEAGRERSGGSYHVSCQHCGHSESRPMAPEQVDEAIRVAGGGD